MSARSLEIAARRLAAGHGCATRSGRGSACCQSSLTYSDERLRRSGRRRADGGDRARRPASAARAGAQRVRVAPRPATVIVTTPERRAQRAVRDPARPARSGTVITGSSGPGPSSPLGRAGGDRARLRVRFAPVGADDPEVGPPTQLAVFSRAVTDRARNEGSGAMTPSDRDLPFRTEPGRADRGVGLGQVDLRPDALPADRGGVLRRLPRYGGRRRERPVGHQAGVRAAAHHRRDPAAGRTADRGGRHERPARGPEVPAWRWPGSTTCCRWRSCSTPRRVSASPQLATGRTGPSAPEVVRRQHDQLRRGLRGLEREGFRTVHRLRGAGEIDRADDHPDPALQRPARRSWSVRRDRRRPRLPGRAGDAARPISATDHPR